MYDLLMKITRAKKTIVATCFYILGGLTFGFVWKVTGKILHWIVNLLW